MSALSPKVEQPGSPGVVKAKKVRTFPYVAVGQTVVWYHHGKPSMPPHPAVVAEVGERNIVVKVLYAVSDITGQHSGCYHVGAAGVNPGHREETGGWDLTDADKRLRAIHPELNDWPE